MAAQADMPPCEAPPSRDGSGFASIWKKLTRKQGHTSAAPPCPPPEPEEHDRDASPSSGAVHRSSRKVVPGLPRAKTFKRQQSEEREKLEAVKTTAAERRAVSVDRKGGSLRHVSRQGQHLPRASAPSMFDDKGSLSDTTAANTFSAPQSPLDDRRFLNLSDASTAVNSGSHPPELPHVPKAPSSRLPSDAGSFITEQYEREIHDELEHKWILNLSMHFRDKSKREKFFITYREKESLWRRVTISLDYRSAPPDSLEQDLTETQFQRDKNQKIYEAIRDSLQDIQFYDTVTNLKLQTTDGRLHVHVVEDVNEIIHYPTVRMVQHLRCRRVKERELQFDSHMSGFVYKVRIGDQTLIKKEIPGPDTVDEFLYEVNALNSLMFSESVIDFYGVVVDDNDEYVRGLLIDFAEQGALIDMIYDSQERGFDLDWPTRERWARQIVQGLSDIHEAGFVQGDFTLSNIVIDHEHNAKIIDINRRGCPVGWEPPEATPLIDSNQRISMYIGVKSDLYQLGMVLWALATLEDEPEAHRRPLHLDPDLDIPKWYRRMVENCLNANPRVRLQATALLAMFPEPAHEDYDGQQPPSISVDDGYSLHRYMVDGYGPSGAPEIRSVTPQYDWGYSGMGYHTSLTSPSVSNDGYYYPPRGRSPPSPLPSHRYGVCDSPYAEHTVTWSDNNVAPSVDDVEPDQPGGGTPKEAQSEAAVPTGEKSEETLKAGRLGRGLSQIQVTEDADATPLATDSQVTEPVLVPRERPLPEDGGDEKQQQIEALPQGERGNSLSNQDEASAELRTDPQVSSIAHTAPAQETPPQETHEKAPAEDTALREVGRTEPKRRGGEEEEDENEDDKLDAAPFPERLLDHDCGTGDPDYGPSFEPSYTHTSGDTDKTYTRPTEAGFSGNPDNHGTESPHRERWGDLTGIGAAYGKAQDEIRQPACSDEDLGLTTSTTTTATASQNVTSQA